MSEANDSFGLVGTTLQHKYRVDAVVGEGGFGVVYRGFHMSFEQDIAIKCLKIPPHFTLDAQRLFVEKFREEGKHLASLSSAHLAIVRVFDFDVATSSSGASIPYLVLEWLRGRSLEAVMEERRKRGDGGMDEQEALALLRPAVEALAVAHGMGIAHRDVKPANLFATEGRGAGLKVLDFGIAKAMQEGETATQVSTRTTSGFSAFSPQYGAPEQFHAKKFGATGPWTDVHALGLCLVELVTGKGAFDGDTHPEFYEASTGEQRPTPRVRGAPVSQPFEQLCERALARMPKDRFATAEEMLTAMDAVSGGAPAERASNVAISAKPAPRRGSGTELAPAPPPIVSGDGPPRPKTPTLLAPATESTATAPARKVAPAVAVVVAIAAAVGLYVATRSNGEAARTTREDARTDQTSSPPPRAPGATDERGSAAGPLVTSSPDPAPPEVVITLEIDPPDAEVELDGVRYKVHPLRVSASNVPHQLVVRAPGYEPMTREVVAQKSVTVAIALKKIAPATVEPTAKPTAQPPKPPPTQRPQNPAPTQGPRPNKPRMDDVPYN